MWTYNYNYSDELYHHGVLGMKWGVRRYQNADGSLTAAGRNRYGDNDYGHAKAEYKNAHSNYNKSFHKAYSYSDRHRISQYFGKNKKKADALWEDAYTKAEISRDAKRKYKKAKFMKDATSKGGQITKSGKYKASNGTVIARSNGSHVEFLRKFSTTPIGQLLGAAGDGERAKLTGRAKEAIKAQRKMEYAALKEYYSVGGDKMLDKYNKRYK